MKTTAEKRRFALPIGIAVAAHAFLLLGFSPPKTHIVPKTETAEPKDKKTLVVELQPETPPEEFVDSPPKAEVPSRPDVVIDTPNPEYLRMKPEPFDPSDTRPPTNVIPVNWTSGKKGLGGYIGIVPAINLDKVPRAIVRVPPAYPAQLRALGVSGEVYVDFVVDEAGRVSDVRVLRSSREEFESVAIKALVKWRFEPGSVHGKPVRFRMAMPLNFTIGD